MPLLHRMNPQLRSTSHTTSQKCSLHALEQPLGNVSLKNKNGKMRTRLPNWNAKKSHIIFIHTTSSSHFLFFYDYHMLLDCDLFFNCFRVRMEFELCKDMTPYRQVNSDWTPEKLATPPHSLNNLRKLRTKTVFIPEELYSTATHFG